MKNQIIRDLYINNKFYAIITRTICRGLLTRTKFSIRETINNVFIGKKGNFLINILSNKI